jgi:hypothetical protein
MKKIYFINILLLFSCSKPDKYDKEQFYGDYNPLHSETGMVSFQFPDSYYILNYKIAHYDVVRYDLMEKGTYKIKDDSILLFSDSNRKGSLFIINEDKLVINKLNKFIYNDTLFCYERKDKNGKTIYGGIWENGKREGEWFYNHKKFTEWILYKDGEIVKRDTDFAVKNDADFNRR